MTGLLKLGAVSILAAAVFFGVVPGIVEKQHNQVVGPKPAPVSAHAAALHKTLQIADMHADTLLWSRDLNVAAGRGHVDLPRMTMGNMALQVFSSVTKSPKHLNYDANRGDSDDITLLSVAQGQPIRTWNSLLQRSLWHAEKLQRAQAASGGRLRIVQSRTDVKRLLADRAAGAEVMGVMLSVEGLHNLEGRFDNLDRLYAAGFRMAGLVHFFDNELAGSMHGVAKGGLTPFGLRVMRAMQAQGMIVDIAHASHATVADVLRETRAPIVSSHGGVQATCKVNRNLTDDEIRGVAASGGIVGIGYWDAAVCDISPAGIVHAIAHVRDLVGVEHVGLGSDFDGSVTTQFDVARLDAITAALIDAGFTDAEITQVMGGNVLGLLGRVLPET